MKHYLLATLLLALNTQAFAQENVVHRASETSKPIIWPDLSDSYLKTGDFVSISALKSVGAGQNYDQVRLAIGNPHFSEGLGHPDAFNYVFNFYTNPAKTEWITCQYQVTFDKKRHHVDGRYWRERQCAQFLADPAPPAPIIVKKREITLASDGMFAFDRSTISDLQQTGRDNLDRLAQQILTSYSTIHGIEIVGHTDRMGSVEYNQRLSQARADTVRMYLASKGVAISLMKTQGAGLSMPIQSCPGPKSAAVIACLLPNRRVSVVVSGEEK